MKLQNILENKKSFAISDEYPFLNNKYIQGLEVEDAQIINNISAELILNDLGEYPKFKNLTFKDIIDLRILVHFEVANSIVYDWLEKILRYCEINYVNLKNNEKKYARTREDSIKLFNQIIALFVEYYLLENDLLFLNTALKITDIKWIVPTSSSSLSTKALRVIKVNQIHEIIRTLENE